MRAVLGVLLLLAACGDNDVACGDGTIARDGRCEPKPPSPDAQVICGAGTMFAPVLNACVPVDGICGDGTILVGGECRDPDALIPVDLEEGLEPNGLGDAVPAGLVTLKAIGDPHGVVIHGCIDPSGDTADLDAYEITVNFATLLHVTVAGVGGLEGGFVAVATSDPSLATWHRIGVTATGATAHRDIYLPIGGTYRIAMTDTRSLWSAIDGGGTDALPPAGGGGCYYATIDQETITPEPLPTVTAGAVLASGTIGEHVHVYTLPLAALPDALYEISNHVTDTHAAPALVLITHDRHRAVDGGLDAPARLPFSATASVGVYTLTADTVWSYGATDASFELVADYAVPGVGSVVGIERTLTSTTLPPGSPVIAGASVYRLPLGFGEPDVLLDLHFSLPVQGEIVDGDGNVYADFGGLGPSLRTWTDFTGTWQKLPASVTGGYFLAVIAPRSPPGSTLLLTSTATEQAFFDDLPLDLVLALVPGQLYAWESSAMDHPCVRFSSAEATTMYFYAPTALGRLAPIAETIGPPTTLATWVTDPGAPPFATIETPAQLDMTALPSPFLIDFSNPASFSATDCPP